MKFKTVLVALVVLAISVAMAPASWANSLTYQNVTFDINSVNTNTFSLSITNALNATGDWAPAVSLS